jgi:hypothetical protein
LLNVRDRQTVLASEVAEDPATKRLLERAELAARLAPLMAAAARGAVFEPRLLDARLWRGCGASWRTLSTPRSEAAPRPRSADC